MPDYIIIHFFNGRVFFKYSVMQLFMRYACQEYFITHTSVIYNWDNKKATKNITHAQTVTSEKCQIFYLPFIKHSHCKYKPFEFLFPVCCDIDLARMTHTEPIFGRCMILALSLFIGRAKNGGLLSSLAIVLRRPHAPCIYFHPTRVCRQQNEHPSRRRRSPHEQHSALVIKLKMGKTRAPDAWAAAGSFHAAAALLSLRHKKHSRRPPPPRQVKNWNERERECLDVFPEEITPDEFINKMCARGEKECAGAVCREGGCLINHSLIMADRN